jgi:hypothetical protein
MHSKIAFANSTRVFHRLRFNSSICIIPKSPAERILSRRPPVVAGAWRGPGRDRAGPVDGRSVSECTGAPLSRALLAGSAMNRAYSAAKNRTARPSEWPLGPSGHSAVLQPVALALQVALPPKIADRQPRSGVRRRDGACCHFFRAPPHQRDCSRHTRERAARYRIPPSRVADTPPGPTAVVDRAGHTPPPASSAVELDR